ncbi:MAG: alkaline phosphatase family protein [Candidatus Thorarchaeota archaeon]
MTNGLRFTGASLMLLLLGCTGLLVGGIFGYLNYTNPYSYVPTPQVALIDSNVIPAANYTIIFVLDGVRADFFYETRKSGIDAYGDWANFTDVQCSSLLSVSRAGYGVISSGVNTSESQVISNDHAGTFDADSLWNTTLRNGGTTAFIGSDTWYELFGNWMNYSVSFRNTYPGEATVAINVTSGGSPIEDDIPSYSDAIASDYAIQIANGFTPTLMVVHFSETDEIGHELGPLSDENRVALERQDSYITQILAAYDAVGILNSTLVIVTSDHGQVAFPDRGGQHGGTERAALHIPLLLRGPHVLPGIYADSRHQNSIAPTVSVLMGWAIPSDASGSALFECLNLSTREEAVHRINQAGLRLRQATSRVQTMGYAYLFESHLDSAGAALSEAEANYASSEYEAALTYAKLAESQSNAVLTTSWNSKVSEEISLRFVGLLIILGILCGIIMISSGGRSRLRFLSEERVSITLSILASLLYLALLALIPSLSGWQFSASYIAAYLYEFIYLISAASLVSFFVAFVVLNILARVTSKDVSQLNLLDILKRFLLITVTVYLLSFAFFVGINSFGLPWYSIDITVPLMYFFILLSGIFFVVYAIISILVIQWFQKSSKTKGLQT